VALRDPVLAQIIRWLSRAFDAAGASADDALTSEVLDSGRKQANARRGGREIRLLCALTPNGQAGELVIRSRDRAKASSWQRQTI